MGDEIEIKSKSKRWTRTRTRTWGRCEVRGGELCTLWTATLRMMKTKEKMMRMRMEMMMMMATLGKESEAWVDPCRA
jgi:hypothetical protein